MSSARALLELAIRCEREEPSRELDQAIASWFSQHEYEWWKRKLGSWDFTRSLDAAVSLVPEECGIDWQRYWMKEGERWSANLTWGISGDYAEVLDAKTAALALCAAALKARAALTEQIRASKDEGKQP